MFIVSDYISVEHEDKRLDINILKTELDEKLFFFFFLNTLGSSCLPNAHTLLLLFFSGRALIQ